MKDVKIEIIIEFLDPVWLAALHLGCTPVRSSRSQRNESTRCYLKRENPVPAPGPPSSSTNFQCLQYLTVSGSKADHTHNNSIRKRSAPNEVLIPSKDLVPNDDGHAYASSTKWSVYPLYYDKQVQPDGLYATKRSVSCSSGKLVERDAIENFSFPSSKRCASNEENGIECDLTLRLGSLVVPCASVGNSSPLVAENGHSWASVSGSKIWELRRKSHSIFKNRIFYGDRLLVDGRGLSGKRRQCSFVICLYG